MQVQKIALEKIKPSPFNPRKDFNKEALAELAASLTQHGQQEPIKLRPVNGHYEIVFGERRFRAAQLAGLKDLEAIVEQLDDKTTDVLRLVENVKRRDLTVFEEAEHLKLLHEKHKVKIDDLATQVGIAARTVRENIKLAGAAPEVRKLVLAGDLKLSLAKLISRLPNADTQETVAIKAKAEGFTHEELEKYIREHHMQDLRFAPFDIRGKGLECLAATCVDCPRNARNLKDEMPDLKGADICTSPENYQKKVIAFGRAEAARQGVQFMEGRHLFNRWGELDMTPGRRSALYVRADAEHPKDPKQRPWRELIGPEDLKKLLVIVLTPKNELMDLLDNEKGEVDAAVKAGGKLAKAQARDKEKTAAKTEKSVETSREQSEKEFHASLLKRRAAAAVVAQLVAKMTKWPKVEALKATAKQHLAELDFDWHKPELGMPPESLPQRRGWETPDAAEKAIDKMKENEVLTLIWEATFDYRMSGIIQGQFSEVLLDFAKLLGIDVKKIEATENHRVAWVDNIKPDMEIPGVSGHTKSNTAMVGLGRVPYSIDVHGPNNVSLSLRENGQWYTPETYKTVQIARSAAELHTATGKLPPGEKKPSATPKPAPKAKKKAAKAKRGGAR